MTDDAEPLFNRRRGDDLADSMAVMRMDGDEAPATGDGGDQQTRSMKLYGALYPAMCVETCDVIMHGNSKMKGKGKLPITEKSKITAWIQTAKPAEWADWNDEDWRLTDNYIVVVMRKKLPRGPIEFSGFGTLMLADPALHGRVTLNLKDVLTHPKVRTRAPQ